MGSQSHSHHMTTQAEVTKHLLNLSGVKPVLSVSHFLKILLRPLGFCIWRDE
jgi:hypothetical protein